MKKVFFSWMKRRLEDHPDSVLLLCDLGYPEALELLAAHPQRALNVGVCEQNAAVVAKGLCAEGFEVFIYGISAFSLWRAAEALRLYFGAQDALRVIGNGGGFGYGIMGSSHHSLDDLGLVSLWPTWTAWMPRRDEELSSVLDRVSSLDGPHYVRLTNNSIPGITEFQDVRVSGSGEDLTVVSFGPLADVVEEALPSQARLFSLHRWPVDLRPVQAHFETSGKIIFFEEHQREGGLSQKIAATLNGDRRQIHIHCVRPTVLNGSRHYLLATQGFDRHNIRRTLSALSE